MATGCVLCFSVDVAADDTGARGVLELTGGPLRDKPAERNEVHARREQLWAELDRLLKLGTERAATVANPILRGAQDLMGLVR